MAIEQELKGERPIVATQLGISGAVFFVAAIFLLIITFFIPATSLSPSGIPNANIVACTGFILAIVGIILLIISLFQS